MYYNPATDHALRTLEQLAEDNRKVIMKLDPPVLRDIVWDSIQGRWVRTQCLNNPSTTVHENL